ncbi:MAG TPA: cupin domain-containing protein [Gaiellaceae bacterium]|jgi:mannose-6-phosphate isomerase-like protein (cupin superfamily)
MNDAGYEILTLDEVETAEHRGSNLIPVRYTLGYRPAGVNAWIADAGGQLIPPHEEDSGNQELYVVVRGRASFVVDDETQDAPAGSLIFVEAGHNRTATAEEDGTIVFVVGATIGEAFNGGGWDTFAVAYAAQNAGDMDACRRIMAEEMEKRPDSWALPYNMACLEALAGNKDEAIALLNRIPNGPELRGYLENDTDLDDLRDDPRFQELLS